VGTALRSHARLHDLHAYHPSILFWEAGNSGISADHMKQMKEIKERWDPHGGASDRMPFPQRRGGREVCGYFGIMVGQDSAKDKRKTPADEFAVSAKRDETGRPLSNARTSVTKPRAASGTTSPAPFRFQARSKDAYHLEL